MYDETAPLEHCDAEDLIPGDVFPSHDGFTHDIVDVDFTADSPFGHVVVTVERSNGTRYSTEFDRHARVSVLA